MGTSSSICIGASIVMWKAIEPTPTATMAAYARMNRGSVSFVRLKRRPKRPAQTIASDDYGN